MSDAQWIDVAFKVEPDIRGKAKENERSGGNKAGVGRATLPNPVNTDKALALIAGTGSKNVQKQRYVREHDPEKYAEADPEDYFRRVAPG